MDIIGAFEEKIKMNEIMPLWETYKFDLGKVLKYTNSNINKANLILDEILEDEEKICLEQAFFGDDGWYKRINGKGMNELKLAAMSLGLTNDIFTFHLLFSSHIKTIISKLRLGSVLKRTPKSCKNLQNRILFSYNISLCPGKLKRRIIIQRP